MMRSLCAISVLAALTLVPTGSRAEAPACVELVLPEALPQRESWRSLLQQETKPLATAAGHSCAQIVVRIEPGAHDASALQISWDTQLRTLPLALGQLPIPQRPRAAALLARGALQQLVQASDNAERERAAAEQSAARAAPGVSRSTRDTPTSSGSSAPSADAGVRVDRATKTASSTQDARDERQPLPAAKAVPKPPPGVAAASASTLLVATPRADQDDDLLERRTRRRAQWSGSALAGSTVIVNKLTPLIHLELAVLRRIDAMHARVGMGLLGSVTQTRWLKLGGPGVRVGLDFALTQSPLARVWLGPGGSVSELVLARTAEAGRTRRSVHTVASVDVRLNLELVMSRRSQLLLALEAAYVVRYLDVRRDDNRMLAYAGPLIGLHVGAGF